MSKPQVTFIEQNAPIDEYGRALYAVSRSVLRAMLDTLTEEDLTDLNTPLLDVRMRQLAKVARVDRDKGLRGDGFEWAVHEAILGKEERVIDPLHHAMRKASKFVKDAAPQSLMFGHERARYLGFTDAVVDAAGAQSYILPEGSGRPFHFGTWVANAAQGKVAEAFLPPRIQQIWKTDLFVSAEDDARHFAATVKSNFDLLEGGRGLRIGIVPESTHPLNRAGVRYSPAHRLWIVTLADPNGFMGLFNDAYQAVGRAIITLGKQPLPAYWTKPSAKAQRIEEQLKKYPDATVIDIESALDEAAQQDLVSAKERLVGVNAPNWLHIKQLAPRIISPKPRFDKLD
ncbi:hypothetical protein FHS55_000298 [Angulomicrobium tetraedrale]|uniref:Uncharacterized protein n=1 Tax=Ancylobacter tetraedralis TaxID=217068 RepID=A0A839Z223_9HYPH|nr:hypothetical protein [Ancylobacter tetraedralis]MBB3769712.1 hypothetical protein [Ancylobacter tetraedralis]